MLQSLLSVIGQLVRGGLAARRGFKALHILPLQCVGVNAFLAASNVTARNNAGGFTGGGLHLQNTQHLLPGVPLSGITVNNNTCAFAGGFAVFGGTLRAPLACTWLA